MMQHMSDDREALGALDDERLMGMAAGGDMLPFEILVGRYEREIAGFARKMLRNRDDAEDVLQETFLRIWRAKQTYRSGNGFRPYLYAVARNAIKDRHKVNSARSTLPNSPIQRAADAGADEKENAERRETLSRALNELPEPDRTVLVLAKFQRLSYREIAQATGLDLKAVEY